ncbi:MAG TPA: hypothetical protein VEW46_13215, partial [Pyrinomonadaceae bacterium]|nr:hypothetical protein [Pyrinomonadaceae bacterium]
PRVGFETLGSRRSKRFFATLKELRCLRLANGDATPSELRLLKMNASFPGLPKRNPGLELANAFSVIQLYLQFSHTLGSDRVRVGLKFAEFLLAG